MVSVFLPSIFITLPEMHLKFSGSGICTLFQRCHLSCQP